MHAALYTILGRQFRFLHSDTIFTFGCDAEIFKYEWKPRWNKFRWPSRERVQQFIYVNYD